MWGGLVWAGMWAGEPFAGASFPGHVSAGDRRVASVSAGDHGVEHGGAGVSAGDRMVSVVSAGDRGF